MRSSLVRFGIVSVLALTACEYEFKDEPVRQQEEIEIEEDVDAPEEESNQEEQKQAAPAARPTLAPGKPYQGSTTIPADAKRIDLLNLEATNQATMMINVPGGATTSLFDGSDDSHVRTPGINPLDTTITLTAPTKIKALRVRSTYSDFAVAVQIDDGERIILDPIPDGDWATMVWSTPITAKKVFVQILRRTRDNYVHANEIELYQ